MSDLIKNFQEHKFMIGATCVIGRKIEDSSDGIPEVLELVEKAKEDFPSLTDKDFHIVMADGKGHLSDPMNVAISFNVSAKDLTSKGYTRNDELLYNDSKECSLKYD